MVLTGLALVVGYLTISLSTALLYATWLSGAGNEMMPQFLAFASVCALGFATLSGWLTALVAQRAVMAHAIALALILAITGGLYSVTGEPEEARSLLLLNLAIAMVGAIAGGCLRRRQMKTPDSTYRQPNTTCSDGSGQG